MQCDAPSLSFLHIYPLYYIHILSLLLTYTTEAGHVHATGCPLSLPQVMHASMPKENMKLSQRN